MKLTDEQIASILTKDVTCKTILVYNDNVFDTILAHQKEGWTFVTKTEINGKVKLTFKK